MCSTGRSNLDHGPQLPTDAKFSPNVTLRVRDIRALPPEMGQLLTGPLTYCARACMPAHLLACLPPPRRDGPRQAARRLRHRRPRASAAVVEEVRQEAEPARQGGDGGVSRPAEIFAEIFAEIRLSTRRIDLQAPRPTRSRPSPPLGIRRRGRGWRRSRRRRSRR